MKKIPKQEYTAEFKALAVKRVKDGLTVGAAARELGLIDQTLRHSVKRLTRASLAGRAYARSHRSKWSFPVYALRTPGSSARLKFEGVRDFV